MRLIASGSLPQFSQYLTQHGSDSVMVRSHALLDAPSPSAMCVLHNPALTLHAFHSIHDSHAIVRSGPKTLSQLRKVNLTQRKNNLFPPPHVHQCPDRGTALFVGRPPPLHPRQPTTHPINSTLSIPRFEPQSHAIAAGPPSADAYLLPSPAEGLGMSRVRWAA